MLLHMADIIFIIIADALVPRRQPSTRLQALIGENENANAAGPPSKPEN